MCDTAAGETIAVRGDDSRPRDNGVAGPVRAVGPFVHELLELDSDGHGGFIGRPMKVGDRVYGGLVLGQSVAAANATIPADRLLRSVHAEFIREGKPSEPVRYQVNRIRDGRTYTRRQVTASQRGEVIFLQTGSYSLDSEGPSHQRPAPAVSEHPAELPEVSALPVEDYAGPQWLAGQPEIDIRVAPRDEGHGQYGLTRFWYRYREPLPDDPLLHAALWSFLSDMSLLVSVRLPHVRKSRGPWLTSSLDHVSWLHGRIRCTDWLRVDQVSDRMEAGFGVATAKVFDQQGRQVSTIAQHGLMRWPRSG
jgi:acyl-CoA thioesterase-2